MSNIKLFKKISFLGKKKLIWKGDQKDFSIAIYKQKNQNPFIEVEFHFKNLDQTLNDCNVVFEFYQTGYTNTTTLGDVFSLRGQKKTIEIIEISYELIKCSIKITNSSTGKIEAFADRIKPEFIDEDNNDEKVSLDNKKTSSWIRWRTKPMNKPWHIDLEEGEKPICWLNSQINLKKNLNNSNIHKTLIHPIIFREVLLKYIATTDIGDDDVWKKNIIKIAESFLGPIPREDVGNKLALTPEINNWIEDVADSYAKKFSFVDKYVKESDE